MTRLVMDFQKAVRVADEDGVLTSYGMKVAESYARRWVDDGVRDLLIEREHAELAGLFYDIRADATLARAHAVVTPDAGGKTKAEGAAVKKSLAFVIPVEG